MRKKLPANLKSLKPHQFKPLHSGEPLAKQQFQIRLHQSDHEALMAIPVEERLALVREVIGSTLMERGYKS